MMNTPTGHFPPKADHESELRARVRALESENARLRRLVMLDDLTGAYNRRYFAVELASALQVRARQGGFALCLFDVDDFKRVNDAHGHSAGDSLLRAISLTVGQRLRRSGDKLCRLGGDEFASIFSAATPQAALEQARNLLAAIRSLPALEAGPQVGAVTATFGVAWVTAQSHTHAAWDQAYMAADRALYRAKRAGKNQVVLAGYHDGA